MTLWLVRKVEKFPRSFRFSVGDGVIARSLDLLEALVDAAYSAGKRGLGVRRAARLEGIWPYVGAGERPRRSGRSQEADWRA